VTDVADSNGALSLRVDRQRSSAEVVAVGEVDIHTCAQLEETLTGLVDAGVSRVTLDLSQVAFIDSSGLRALVVGHKALEERGGSLVVANPSTMAARLLEVTGLKTLFGGDGRA
jgi:anti-sigma B factor antagonist